MKTIPDIIDDIRYYWKRTKDVPLSWMEHMGSKMKLYAWNKRWSNREKGTGYHKRRILESYMLTHMLEKHVSYVEIHIKETTEYFYGKKHHSNINTVLIVLYCM